MPSLDQPLDQAGTTSFSDEVDIVLRAVKQRVDAKYQSHGIEALPTKTTRQDPDQPVVLNYALYLSFAGRDHFSYRLFELVSKENNGGFPVTVHAFSGPPVPFGTAPDAETLRRIIDTIFEDTRFRWIINTYYKP